MPRRSHKKSRFGCANCKKRHVKCDETRPQCVNCKTFGSQCSFLLPTSISRRSRATPDPQEAAERTEAPRSRIQDSHVTKGDSSNLPLNMKHLSLFYYVALHCDQLFGREMRRPEEQRELLLGHALNNRYLMSVVLAIAALRQSLLEPGKFEEYHAIAMELLDAGIKEFKEHTLTITEQTIVPVFLCTNMITVYTLCDTFAIHRAEDPEAFMDRIIDTINVAKGGTAIIQTHGWAYLRQAVVQPILGLDIKILENSPTDRTLPSAKLYELIASSSLTVEEKEVCDQAIERLLHIYAMDSEQEHERVASLLARARAWPVTTNAVYIAMLRRRVPEAMVVLAHWAVLLHPIRFSWTVGDAGRVLLDTVASLLGEEWEGWLEYPRQVVSSP